MTITPAPVPVKKSRVTEILIGLVAAAIVGVLAWPYLTARSTSVDATPTGTASASAPVPTAAPKRTGPPVTTATFEPVYRASKSIQGATQSGVTYIKFGELMQGLSTEISIAKDHSLNATDRELIALYDDAFTAFQASAALWKDKLENKREDGALFVALQGENGQMLDLPRARFATVYELPVTDRVDGTLKYKTIPGDSFQRVWIKANETLQKATALYYGR